MVRIQALTAKIIFSIGRTCEDYDVLTVARESWIVSIGYTGSYFWN
jgi:hypothetical protein